MKRILLLIFVLFIVGCGYGNVDDVKNNAEKTFKRFGFEIVGYSGYEIGLEIPFTRYGGAHVWYRIKNIPDNGIIYGCAIQRWGDEYHLYGLKAIDAIKPSKE